MTDSTRLQQDMVEGVLKRCPFGFIASDRSFRITRVNPAACLLLGQEPDDVLELPLSEVLRVPNFLAVQLSQDVLLDHPLRFEAQFGTRWLDVHIHPHDQGYEAFLAEVTERVAWEIALDHESDHRHLVEQRFESALSVSPLVVFNLDRDLRYTWVYNNQIGTDDQNATGKTPLDYFDDETAPNLINFLHSVLESGQAARAEIDLRPRSCPDKKYFIASAKPLYSQAGKVIGLTGASIDISVIVSQREELRKAQRDALLAKAESERANLAKSKFLAAASHDLRQPVQSLTLLLNLLKTQQGASRVIDTMEMAIDALRSLLEGLLDISKLDAGVIVPNFKIAPIGTVTSGLVEEYRLRAQERGLDLCFVASSMCARTDTALLERALRNLIENALRYTESGRILVGCRRRGNTARIDVIDTGIGIPESDLGAIFEEFHQLRNPARDRNQGLGLGLAIVQRIAGLLGGRIEVQSELGRGSRFSICLPVAYLGESKVAAVVTNEVAGGERVLIIEDDGLLQNTLSLMLEEWGFRPILANSGEAAVAKVEGGERPDLIVSDYRLGPGMTGTDAIACIGETLGTPVPSLIITGDTAPERIKEVFAGGQRILHKPISAGELRRTLADMVKEPRADPAAPAGALQTGARE